MKTRVMSEKRNTTTVYSVEYWDGSRWRYAESTCTTSLDDAQEVAERISASGTPNETRTVVAEYGHD